MYDLHAVILAGGSGSRLWPLSSPDLPKQFLDVAGTGMSLVQSAYQNARMLTEVDRIHLVTLDGWTNLAQQQLPELPRSSIIAEPIRKNTAVATLHAALRIARTNPDALLLILPSDHFVVDSEQFVHNLQPALRYAAEQDELVVAGVRAHQPDIHYGYIQYFPNPDNNPICAVKTFTENPTQEIANAFFRSGDFLWYSGIKVVRASVLFDLYRQNLPELVQLFGEMEGIWGTPKERDGILRLYQQCPPVSFRQGILYNNPKVKVLVGHFGWSDITLWEEVYRVREHDYLDNAVSGRNIATFDTAQCLVMSSSDKPMLLVGLEGFIVIDSENGLLVCPRNRQSEIRQMLVDLKRSKKD